MSSLKRLFLLFISASTIGCASIPAGSERSPSDPWESFNRSVFAFNEGLDDYLKIHIINTTKPVVAFFLFNFVMVGMHWTTVINLMVTNTIFHFFIHGVMLLVSLNMWIPVIGLTKEIKQLSDPGKIAYLFMQSLLPTIPASFLAFGTEPLYSAYLEVDNIFDVSVINDQTMAGLVLKLGGGLILWIFILITWMKWYKTEKTFDDVVRTSTND